MCQPWCSRTAKLTADETDPRAVVVRVADDLLQNKLVFIRVLDGGETCDVRRSALRAAVGDSTVVVEGRSGEIVAVVAVLLPVAKRAVAATGAALRGARRLLCTNSHHVHTHTV